MQLQIKSGNIKNMFKEGCVQKPEGNSHIAKSKRGKLYLKHSVNWSKKIEGKKAGMHEISHVS